MREIPEGEPFSPYCCRWRSRGRHWEGMENFSEERGEYPTLFPQFLKNIPPFPKTFALIESLFAGFSSVMFLGVGKGVGVCPARGCRCGIPGGAPPVVPVDTNPALYETGKQALSIAHRSRNGLPLSHAAFLSHCARSGLPLRAGGRLGVSHLKCNHLKLLKNIFCGLKMVK